LLPRPEPGLCELLVSLNQIVPLVVLSLLSLLLLFLGRLCVGSFCCFYRSLS